MSSQLQKANAILADRFEVYSAAHGHPEATRDLKEIVDKGVNIIATTPPRRVTDATRHVMTLVTTGRKKRLIEEIAADVQDIVKYRGGQYLTGVNTPHGGLLFLPDVMIDDSPQARERWQTFLSALRKHCLQTEDALTSLRGRIPFRSGHWLSDIAFTTGACTDIIRDIQVVEGNLDLRGVAPGSGAVRVKGTLLLDADALSLNTPPVATLSGPVRIYAEGVRTAKDLTASPAMFAGWGIINETRIFINDKAEYTLIEEQLGERTVHTLIESPGGKRISSKSHRFVWDGTNWSPFNRTLPPELAYALAKKIRRIFATLGIGDDFYIEEREVEQTVAGNLSRLICLLSLGRGAHRPGKARTIPANDRKTIQTMEQMLSTMYGLVVGEGAYFYMGPEELTDELTKQMEHISDSKLVAVRSLLDTHCEHISTGKVRTDRKYLNELLSGELSLDDVIGSAGRTLVLLNNLFASKQTRARAADVIAPIKKSLQALLGAKPPQPLLIEILKSPTPSLLKKLKDKHGDNPAAWQNLEKSIHMLSADRPLRLIRDMLHSPYRQVDDELEQDRDLLRRLLEYGHGDLDTVLRPAVSQPDGHLDGKILRNCLLVNLQSFLTEHVRGMSMDLEDTQPTQIVAALRDTLEHFAPAVPENNRRQGQTDTLSPL